MKLFSRVTLIPALSLGLILGGCATAVHLEPYNPLGAKPLPQADKVTVCVHPFEDLSKNGIIDKKWVGSRYNSLGLLDKDYELKQGSISETITQAVAEELSAQGFQVITGEKAHDDCHYIIKGRIRKFWCKYFYDVSVEMMVEAALVDADNGKIIWVKKEQKDAFEEASEMLKRNEHEAEWIGEYLRSARDYAVRKLMRDEKLMQILTKKPAPVTGNKPNP